VRIFFQFPQDLIMRQPIALSERFHGMRQVNANDDAAHIEDHGAWRFFNCAIQEWHG
jgi:hypothetical protein